VDVFKPTTAVCRTSAGPCDVAENCSGVSGACRADAFQPATTECRASAGICDEPESCTGSSAACPTDGFKPSATACRPALSGDAGACDETEFCPGNGANCPADQFKPSSTTCRPAADPQCDIAEKCSGGGPACPTDAFQPGTVPCSDGRFCTADDKCDGVGHCAGGPPPSCSDDNACSTDTCNLETDRCEHASVQPPCEGKMTGGGQILVNKANKNDKRSFGFNARGTALVIGGASGHYNYVNHSTRVHVDGNVTFIYYATPNGSGGEMKFEVTTAQGCKYNVTATDQVEPGSKPPYDHLMMEFVAGSCSGPAENTGGRQPLDSGNIQWHDQ
jgi:hypothetical protein